MPLSWLLPQVGSTFERALGCATNDKPPIARGLVVLGSIASACQLPCRNLLIRRPCPLLRVRADAIPPDRLGAIDQAATSDREALPASIDDRAVRLDQPPLHDGAP